ncbi:amidohydrolase/deacetylase family metallohydrolase [Arenibacter sp. BSSL-BM3]|uniref:Amidohydrolase/deacetylase family metallohydrolase n=1 Tax=Arenibacter arenosicollis TaxID=2762274 RepID=A0ABR7QHX7_9FLAO|nr:amidohydrolase/deacetylase family metallohydrolase [Arenibacter arenosicollis]MBC8766793.1 amidohydrolase/deacetylase family metallohydrolase [Arenibacter arenosicollis]
MKNILKNQIWPIVLLLMTTVSITGQDYDILIKGGHLIDKKNNLDQVMDVAIKDGKIAKVDSKIPENEAKTVIDAKGLLVTPGLLDIHGHNFFGTEEDAYLSNSFSSLPPDGFTLRNGVTTIVDVGGAGWKNFRTFKEQTIDRSKTRVLSFLNIIGSGMKGGAIEQNIEDMNPKMTAYVAMQNKGTIVGVKLAHYSGFDWEPVNRVVEAGTLADIPVMIDFGGSEPELSLETLLMEKLRPGDIFTHAYAHVKGRTPVVDENGKVRRYVFDAQKRGVVFDVGHGGGSFVFEQAIPAIKQGFLPNSISTDLHTGSMNGGMKDILNIMSKFINMGMPVEQVIECTTWNPAQYIKRTDLGHLTVGAVADLTILNLRKGNFGYIDTQGKRMLGDQKLECELTLREGDVVWDLNGISRPMWNAK